jgi:hypothetical protein
MPVFEQAMRDWDAFYNNEPYWTTLHGLDLDDHFKAAGFPAENLVYKAFPAAPGSGKGRKIGIVFVGARKAALAQEQAA